LPHTFERRREPALNTCLAARAPCVKRITHDAETVPATQHVFHDEPHPSRLILPIIPR
jgi:predicted acyl esterase